MTIRSIRNQKRKAKLLLEKNEISFFHMKSLGIGFAAGVFPTFLLKLSGEMAFIPWPLLFMFPVIFVLGVLALLVLMVLVEHIYAIVKCKIKKDCREKSNEDSTHGP